MAIARLAETLLAASGTGSTTYDGAISAPASTPNGVCVIIVQVASAADQVVSVTYGIVGGAVPLTERRFVPISAEAGAVYLYWASGVTFPSGGQTIRTIKTVAAANLRAAVCPMTVAANMQVSVDNDTQSVSTAAVANPGWSLPTTAAVTECYLGIVSGLQTMTTTPRTSPVVWTSIGTAEDATSQGRGWARVSRTSAGETSPGWAAATAEDYGAATIAFKEAPLTAPGGRPPSRQRPRRRIGRAGRAIFT